MMIPAVIYGYQSWTIEKIKPKKNQHILIALLEETAESALDRRD